MEAHQTSNLGVQSSSLCWGATFFFLMEAQLTTSQTAVTSDLEAQLTTNQTALTSDLDT